ncbi:MAG: hypothetical protein F8N36_08720 [Desulfovibrio sp.]|uniref:hypothetical protein n=1 Tax=Desulfovibrio sp. TaxID=885 RepID=UPI00135F083F|nr:hypothetical protein [Desulfovibrio sp.]MTJ92928.1 hypothetical protein [Desulfovibrio sp.]
MIFHPNSVPVEAMIQPFTQLPTKPMAAYPAGVTSVTNLKKVTLIANKNTKNTQFPNVIIPIAPHITHRAGVHCFEQIAPQ